MIWVDLWWTQMWKIKLPLLKKIKIKDYISFYWAYIPGWVPTPLPHANRASFHLQHEIVSMYKDVCSWRTPIFPQMFGKILQYEQVVICKRIHDLSVTAFLPQWPENVPICRMYVIWFPYVLKGHEHRLQT